MKKNPDYLWHLVAAFGAGLLVALLSGAAWLLFLRDLVKGVPR